MKVITVLNRKGGIGKTITAQALYEGLKNKGFRVLAIDIDHQANFTNSILDHRPEYTINDLLLDTKDINECLTSGVIGANMKLSYIDLTRVDIYTLKNALEKVKNNFDFAIIDTPPSINRLTYNALTCANFVILPSECDLYSIEGIKELLANVITDVKKNYNKSLKVSGILLTKYNPRTILNSSLKELLIKLATQFNTKVFKTTIRESVAIKEARASHSELLKYNGGKSNAQKDYKAFIKEFIESERLNNERK